MDRETTTALGQVVAPLHVALRDRGCDEPTGALLVLLGASELHLFWRNGLLSAERDAGAPADAVLDDTARAAYRDRITALRAELARPATVTTWNVPRGRSPNWTSSTAS